MKLKGSTHCRQERSRCRPGQALKRGFTLIEIMLVVGMVGVLSGIAVPAYSNHTTKVRNAECMTTISGLETLLEKYHADYGRYPSTLSEIGKGGTKDPWGRDIQYLNMADDPKNNNCRKLGPVHPLNTDYDLYSSGKDGKSNKPINSGPSMDDIIRAYNGGYVGPASDLI
jgi:general secretion pathway protein G